MKKISIITEHDINSVNGSTVRPKWQIKALEKTGFIEVQLIDKFDKSKLKEISNILIHAHQLSGRFLKNYKFIVEKYLIEL